MPRKLDNLILNRCREIAISQGDTTAYQMGLTCGIATQTASNMWNDVAYYPTKDAMLKFCNAYSTTPCKVLVYVASEPTRSVVESFEELTSQVETFSR